jgi:hypothetical protein
MTDGEVEPPEPRRPSQPEAPLDTTELSTESTADRHSPAPETPDGLAGDRLPPLHRSVTDEEAAPVQSRRPVQPEEPPNTTEQSRQSTAGRHNSAPQTPDGLAEDRLPPLHRFVTDEEAGPRQRRRRVQPEEPLDTAARDPERRATVKVDQEAEDGVRRRKAVAKADRRAAKQAARQMAALEKKEARERKALAKAAARRRSA